MKQDKSYLEKTGQPILSGSFDEMVKMVENYFNGNGAFCRNSTCRTLFIHDKSSDFEWIRGYVLKQEKRVWNLYKTKSI